MAVDRQRLAGQLDRLGYQRSRRSRVLIGEYYAGTRTWVIGRRTFRYANRLDAEAVSTVHVGYDGRIRSVNDERGRRLRSLALEPELLPGAHGGTLIDRTPVTLEDVPRQLVDAVLSVEDQRFFDHGGLDPRRIVGALVANVRARRVVQGASTLTQQLAKNLFLSPRRTPLRKLREVAMALTLERRHSKEEILQTYLNHVYLGQDGARAIHGVGRAAQFYFGKDVTRLELHEAALLAGIIKGPSFYSLVRHPDRAAERRNLVLKAMRDLNVIDDAMRTRAGAAPVRLAKRPRRVQHGRHFVEYVAQELRERHGRGELEKGVTVLTTLDMDLQIFAEEAMTRGLARLERDYPRFRRDDARLEGALIALDPRSGEILAMVGGRDYGVSQFNRAVNARRQPGSAFKPVVALTALTQQRGYTLATALRDEPFTVETAAGIWRPVNYDGRFRGSVSLREALERSLNVPFARLGMDVGPEHIVESARKLGIEGPLNPVPSLALGASEVSPLELTRAFGVLAAEGFRADLHTTLQVLDASGEELSRFEFTGERVYDAAETYLVTSALQGAVERGTGRGLRGLGYGGPVAAKSGTTNDFRDAWFIAYTPSMAVGVWVGFDDGRSLQLPGSRAALPIVARFLKAALGPYGNLDFTIPAGIDVVEVNRDTGLRAGPGCRGDPEVFLRGTAPQESCSPYWASDWRDRRRPTRLPRELRDLVADLLRRLMRGRN
jgi:penicillin-binding protein 1B